MTVETKFSVAVINKIKATVENLIAAFGGRSQVPWITIGSALAGQTNNQGLLYGHENVRRHRREGARFSGDFRVIHTETIKEIAKIAINELWDDLSLEEERIAIEEVIKGFIASDFFIIE
jgi:hypothetical protein